jgi:hypothetical protein
LIGSGIIFFRRWMIFVSGSRIVLKVKKMTRKTNTVLIGLLGTILMGLSTWVIITLVELQVLVMMIQQELMDLDKVIGRIYSHMDRLSQR